MYLGGSLSLSPKGLQALEVCQGPWVSLFCGEELSGKRFQPWALVPSMGYQVGLRMWEEHRKGWRGGKVSDEVLPEATKILHRPPPPKILSSLCPEAVISSVELGWGVAAGA